MLTYAKPIQIYRRPQLPPNSSAMVHAATDASIGKPAHETQAVSETLRYSQIQGCLKKNNPMGREGGKVVL